MQFKLLFYSPRESIHGGGVLLYKQIDSISKCMCTLLMHR